MKGRERFLRWTLILEVAFLAADGVAAALAGSIVVWADLARCSIETVAGFFAWLSLRKITRPSVPGHDYGLGKLENFASVGLALALLVSAGFIVHDALHRFREPQALELMRVLPALILAGIGMVVDSWLGLRSYRMAKREYSPVMESTWRVYVQSVISEAAILAALGLSIGFPAQAWIVYVDPAFSILIVGLMVYAAYSIVTSSVHDLLDGTLEESLQYLILRGLVQHFDDYRNLRGIRSRRAGARIFVEIFLEFDPTRSMGEVQAVIDAMRESMEREIPGSSVSIVPTTEDVPAVGGS